MTSEPRNAGNGVYPIASLAAYYKTIMMLNDPRRHRKQIPRCRRRVFDGRAAVGGTNPSASAYTGGVGYAPHIKQ
jgi:hypothetical protein